MSFDPNSVTDLALGIIAVVGASALIWKIVAKIYLTTKILDNVFHELVPNSGMSLRDAVDRIEVAQLAMGARLDKIETLINTETNGTV